MKYWIAVASREHVLRGVAGGFAQVCHGKAGPLVQMKENDWLLYYSPTEVFGAKSPCQKFTALGRVLARDAYQFAQSEDFMPWRRDIHFVNATEVSIAHLIPQLEFIYDKKRWGYPFRRGCFPISKADFQFITNQMGVAI